MATLLRCPTASKVVYETLLEVSRQINPSSSTSSPAVVEEKSYKKGKKATKESTPPKFVQLGLNHEELTNTFEEALNAIVQLVGEPFVASEKLPKESKASKNKKKRKHPTPEVATDESEGKKDEIEETKPESAELDKEPTTKTSTPPPPTVHILEDLVGHYIIKRLFLNLPNGSNLALKVLDLLRKNNLFQVVSSTNRGAFVVAAALEVLTKRFKTETDNSKDRKAFKKSVEVLKPLKFETSSPGIEVLSKWISTAQSL